MNRAIISITLTILISLNSYAQERRFCFLLGAGASVNSENAEFYSRNTLGLDYTKTYIISDGLDVARSGSVLLLGVPLNIAYKRYDIADAGLSKNRVGRVEVASGLYLCDKNYNSISLYLLPTLTFSGGKHKFQVWIPVPQFDWGVKMAADMDIGFSNLGFCYYFRGQKLMIESTEYNFSPKLEFRIGFHI